MPIASELLEQIPTSARYVHVPLADDENAFALWCEAASSVNTSSLELIEGYFFNEPDEFPRGEDLQKLAAVFQENQRPLDLFNESVRRKGWQHTELFELEDFENLWPMDRIIELRNFGWLNQVKAKWHASLGQFDEAAAVLANLLRSGRMICRGGGTELHFIIAAMCVNIALGGMRQIARLRGCSEPALVSMLNALEHELNEDDGYIKCEQIELLKNLAIVDNFPDPSTPDELIEHFLEYGYQDSIGSDDEKDGDEAATAKIEIASRAERRKRDVRFLLDGHPALLDKRATARLLAEQSSKRIQKVEQSWSTDADCSGDLFLPDSIWPHQLLPNMALDYVGDGPEADVFWTSYADSHGYDSTTYGKYPSSERLAALRDRLRDVPNPVGWLLSGSLVGSDYTHLSFETRARLLGTQVCIALCRFRLKYHRLPTKLAELVYEGLLSCVPIDPFDGQPMRYCRRRQIVWSIGSDGTDDGGHHGDSLCGEMPRDIVFSFKSADRIQAWKTRLRSWWIHGRRCQKH
ncbi:MAG: hypothetical protein KF708_01415 [Pirellulales bacterium]|nr:hypothetical protein [Pirellulales bacterium]